MTNPHQSMDTIKQMTMPETNLRVVVLFLEKLEMLTPEERSTIRKTIDLLNNPMFVSNL